jgi:hypothetical protein
LAQSGLLTGFGAVSAADLPQALRVLGRVLAAEHAAQPGAPKPCCCR